MPSWLIFSVSAGKSCLVDALRGLTTHIAVDARCENAPCGFAVKFCEPEHDRVAQPMGAARCQPTHARSCHEEPIGLRSRGTREPFFSRSGTIQIANVIAPGKSGGSLTLRVGGELDKHGGARGPRILHSARSVSVRGFGIHRLIAAEGSFVRFLS